MVTIINIVTAEVVFIKGYDLPKLLIWQFKNDESKPCRYRSDVKERVLSKCLTFST